VGVVGGGQDLGAPGPDGCGQAVVDVGGGVQAEPAVMMLVKTPTQTSRLAPGDVVEDMVPGEATGGLPVDEGTRDDKGR